MKRSADGDGSGIAADADGGVSLKEGVSKDRMVSVHDPQMDHGRKIKRRRFDGHKAAVVVDTDSQLITAVDVLLGNAADSLGALELVEQSEASAEVPVVEAIRDTAYGDGVPARLSPTLGGSWWPKCRDGPTASASPRTSSPSTWWPVPAPVRRDRQRPPALS